MAVAGLALGSLETLLMVIVIAALAAGTSSSPSISSAGPAVAPSVSTTASAPAASGTPGIGANVRDGKFQFTITRISHAKAVGDSSGLSQTAQGEYTILHVTVTNIGSVAQTLGDSAQFVYDSRGRHFTADSTADLYISGNDVFSTQSTQPIRSAARSPSTCREVTRPSGLSCMIRPSLLASPWR
jgi:hypothetical protein